MRVFLRSFLFIVLILTIDIIFNACKKIEHYKYKFSAVDVNVFSQDKVNSIQQIKNDDDALQFEHIYFAATLKGNLVAKADILPAFFTNSAYAKSYLENSSNTIPLKGIKITSVFAYNNSYSAKSNINDALRFGYSSEEMLYDSANGKNFIKFYNEKVRIQGDEESETVHDRFIIYLNEKPTLNAPQQFAIEIELEDGAVLRDTTFRFMVK